MDGWMDEGRSRQTNGVLSVSILSAGGEIPSVVAAALCRSVCLTLYRSQLRDEKQARGSRGRENNCCVEFHKKHYSDVIHEGGASVQLFTSFCRETANRLCFLSFNMSFH